MDKMARRKERVALMPCNGIGQAISTVIRHACYLAYEEAPDQIILVNSAGAAAGVEKETQNLQDYPVLLVDGCVERCGARLLEEIEVPTCRVVFAPEVLAKHRLTMSGVSRSSLGKNGEKAALAIKEEILALALGMAVKKVDG